MKWKKGYKSAESHHKNSQNSSKYGRLRSLASNARIWPVI